MAIRQRLPLDALIGYIESNRSFRPNGALDFEGDALHYLRELKVQRDAFEARYEARDQDFWLLYAEKEELEKKLGVVKEEPIQHLPMGDCGDKTCSVNRERKMVVLERDAEKVPTIWCDPCIAPLVKVLNDGGFKTVASCCGHGVMPPSIFLEDGTEIIIHRPRQ